MKIEEFWNQAFLAALGRLPAQEAKAEADLATELCIENWQAHHFHWAPQNLLRWQEQEITYVPGNDQRFTARDRRSDSGEIS